METNPGPAEPGSGPSPVVLSAPSGAGKTTIVRALVEGGDGFAFSTSATTRRPREGEAHGVDYWFVSEETFRGMIAGGELAEWAEVHGNLYGTPKKSLEKAGARGCRVILDIDVQGARQIRETVPEALLMFILPPSVEALVQRLSERGTEKEDVLRLRLTTALRELEAVEDFDFFIVNDDLERAVQEVRSLARSGKPPPSGTSGSPEDAGTLRKGIEALLSEDQFQPNR